MSQYTPPFAHELPRQSTCRILFANTAASIRAFKKCPRLFGFGSVITRLGEAPNTNRSKSLRVENRKSLVPVTFAGGRTRRSGPLDLSSTKKTGGHMVDIAIKRKAIPSQVRDRNYAPILRNDALPRVFAIHIRQDKRNGLHISKCHCVLNERPG